MRDGWRSLTREPLVHFVLLGALVFGAHAVIVREPATDDRLVTLAPAVKSDLELEFQRKHGRAPDPRESAELARKWAEDEVLYREGKRLGLESGDPVVRERVISKMKGVVEGLVIVPQPTDADLEAWLAADRRRYETPVRFDLEHAFAKRGRDDGRARAERFAAELEKGASLDGLGDEFAPGARHRHRSLEYLTRTFGKGFADAIASAEPKKWKVLPSDHGWHAVRVTERAGGEKPTVAALRGKLVRDWQNDRKKKLVAEDLAELTKGYRIEAPR